MLDSGGKVYAGISGKILMMKEVRGGKRLNMNNRHGQHAE